MPWFIYNVVSGFVILQIFYNAWGISGEVSYAMDLILPAARDLITIIGFTYRYFDFVSDYGSILPVLLQYGRRAN